MATKKSNKDKQDEQVQEVTPEQIIKILQTDLVYDFIGEQMPRLIGNYRDMKPISDRMEQELRALAVFDLANGLKGDAFTDDIIDEFMKNLKDEYATTHLYLYCNWRAWMTYENDIERAKKYQAVCDKIDDYVFDNWDKKKLEYFIKETD